MSRQNVPFIVKSLLDSFDRCDPTRSNELRPSERMRAALLRRRMRAAIILCICAAAVAVWVAIHA
jgi:hypothetical protein